MADKPLQQIAGEITEVEATIVTTGVAQAGDVVALDSTGHLDPSLLPTGVGPDILVATTSENLSAGNYVNIYLNAGVATVRKADNSNSRYAHGFVKAATLSGANATVYFEGANDALSGLTIGSRYYLGTAGAPTATAPTLVGGALFTQFLGIAVATTSVNTDIADYIKLA